MFDSIFILLIVCVFITGYLLGFGWKLKFINSPPIPDNTDDSDISEDTDISQNNRLRDRLTDTGYTHTEDMAEIEGNTEFVKKNRKKQNNAYTYAKRKGENKLC